MAEFSQELFDTICERIAEGRSLRAICQDEDMPAQSSVFRWLAAEPELQEKYARAREAQADAIFDEILDIADDARNDWMERQNADGSSATLVDHEHVSRSKLRIEARRWMAGKLRPKVYGEKLDLTHANPDGTPITFQTIIEKKPE